MPSGEKLFELLKQHGGDVRALLEWVTPFEDMRPMLLFEINRTLNLEENQRVKREWERLKQIREETRLELLRMQIVEDVTDTPRASQRKTDFGRNTKKISDLAHLWGGKGERVTKKEKKENKLSDEFTRSLESIRQAMIGEDEDEWQEVAANA